MSYITPEIIKELYGDFEELEIYQYDRTVDIVSQGILCISEALNDIACKCKNRATQYGFIINSGNRLDGTGKYDVLAIHGEEDIECSEAVFYNEIYDTEAEATIKAFQWILAEINGANA